MGAKSIELSLIVTDSIHLQSDSFDRNILIDRALRPLLNWIKEFPRLNLAFQFSQGLRQDIISDPELNDTCVSLIKDGRLEWLSGSPVNAHLHALPKGGAQVHLSKDLEYIDKHYQYQPTGFLPFGLCWDHRLIPELSKKNIRYCLVDRGSVDTALGWTEYQGIRCGVIGVDHRLSSLIPWAHPKQFFKRLHQLSNNGDRFAASLWRIEDLGGRLNSQHLAWNENRMNALATAMMRSQNWLKSILPKDALRPQDSRVYPVPGKRRGNGFSPWERDYANYPIVGKLKALTVLLNDQILLLSDYLRQNISPGLVATIEELKEDLYVAQSAIPTSPYPLGALELPLERHAVWARLESAIREAELHTNTNNDVQLRNIDTDCDGEDEVWIRTGLMRLNINPRLTGGIGYCSPFSGSNVINVLNRREMVWHQNIDLNQLSPSLNADLPIVKTAKPHLRIEMPLDYLSRFFVDDIERGLFIDSVYDHRLTHDNIINGCSPTVPLTFKSPYRLIRQERIDQHIEIDFTASVMLATVQGNRSVSLQKRYKIYEKMPVIDVEYTFENTGLEPIDVLWGSGFSFNTDGVITPERYFFVEPSPVRFNLLKSGERLGATSATWRMGEIGIQMTMWPECRFIFHPIEVPSVDKNGVIMRFQGQSSLNVWPLSLWSGEKTTLGVSIHFERLS